jgi:hypothetical protein
MINACLKGAFSLRHCEVQPACLELPLLDPQVARKLGIVAADLFHEALGSSRRMKVSMASPKGEDCEVRSSRTPSP